MDLLLEPALPAEKATRFWRNPVAWVREKSLSRGYWVFFTVAFFYDAGLSIYFFLFNLYLLDHGFNERAMGWIGGTFTLGSLVGTLPAGALARKVGLRPLLIVLFLTAPGLNAARALWVWEPAQIGLAFLTGLSMSTWGICFLSAVGRLTTEKNRPSGFSLIFSVSLGTSMLGGIVCGYLRQWLERAGFALQPVEVKRLILLLSCGIMTTALFPALRLRMPPLPEETKSELELRPKRNWVPWRLNPFLLRFLPIMALWSAVLTAFSPYANVYLARDLHITMTRIGLIFTATQLVQFSMGLCAPFLFRKFGLMNGIMATQVSAALILTGLAGTRHAGLAIALYMTFSAAQWVSAPGLYSMLMNETPDAERSSAASMTMFSNSLTGSASTAAAGVLFTWFGYPPVMLGIAAMALGVSILFRVFVHAKEKPAEIAAGV